MQLNVPEKIYAINSFSSSFTHDVSRRENLNGQFLDWIKHTDPRCRSQEKEGGKERDGLLNGEGGEKERSRRRRRRG